MQKSDLPHEYSAIGKSIIGCAFEVRRTVGRGLREKYYESALVWELRQRGHDVKRQHPIRALYKGVEVDDCFVADILVDDKVIIETKALKSFTESEVRQLYTYLYLTGCRLGYIINFGVDDFRTANLKTDQHPYSFGIYRVVNTRGFEAKAFSPSQ
ncbi:MAG: GxxExxY protein [Bacteroides sp.]|nr:GxxExxY protein [Bacteroides sp.]